MTREAALPISPPTNSPCSIRKTRSRIGAAANVFAPGIRPMAAVEMPMPTTVIIRAVLRPIRSPTWPQTRPPMGRRRNPNANVAKERSVPEARFWFGKNTVGNTVAEARPYR